MAPLFGAGEPNQVYVLTPEHSWVPCRLLEKNGDLAVVSLPDPRKREDIISDGGSKFQKGAVKETVNLNDYPNKILPYQNVNDSGKLVEYPDMVDLPFLHEVRQSSNCFEREPSSPLTTIRMFFRQLFSIILNLVMSPPNHTQEQETLSSL
jgi:hypothetical protein